MGGQLRGQEELPLLLSLSTLPIHPHSLYIRMQRHSHGPQLVSDTSMLQAGEALQIFEWEEGF